MKKVMVVPKYSPLLLKKKLEKFGFKIVDREPHLIILYGGDGTILSNERKYPGVPKLIFKKSTICRKYDYVLSNMDFILNEVKNGNYEIEKELKLETKINRIRLVALNEIQIRAKLPIHALRFSTSIDGYQYSNLIGDGIIVATPFGSTGYYKSTGGEKFQKGIGLSFNNLYNRKIKSSVYPENSVIKTKINRGPALVLIDNYRKFFQINNYDTVLIKKSDEIANFIYVKKEN